MPNSHGNREEARLFQISEREKCDVVEYMVGGLCVWQFNWNCFTQKAIEMTR